MKLNKIFLPFVFILSSCGTIGIGKNNLISVFNDSNDVIITQTDNGFQKIQPKSTSPILSKSNTIINSTNVSCNSAIIPTKTNKIALILDILPGFIFGVIPIVVDAAMGNLLTVPSTYTYQCIN